MGAQVVVELVFEVALEELVGATMPSQRDMLELGWGCCALLFHAGLVGELDQVGLALLLQPGRRRRHCRLGNAGAKMLEYMRQVNGYRCGLERRGCKGREGGVGVEAGNVVFGSGRVVYISWGGLPDGSAGACRSAVAPKLKNGARPGPDKCARSVF